MFRNFVKLTCYDYRIGSSYSLFTYTTRLNNNEICISQSHGHKDLITGDSRKQRLPKNSFPKGYAPMYLPKFRQFFTNSALGLAKSSHSRNCWKCGRNTNPDRELFFCECGVIQIAAKDLNYFELLQTEKSFDINVNELSQKFKDTQRLLHPDKFSTKSMEEQAYAEEQSSLLNQSYYTLLKPLTRAIYLLGLDGVTISESDNVTDAEFLMDMLDGFELIETASSPRDVKALEESNNARIEKCIQKLSTAFLESDLIKAKELTIELRYFTTILDKIKELKEKSFG